MDERIGVLYLAPWLDIGGSDKGTLDWFRLLDRDRFRASLITTQPSRNRRLAEAAHYAEEVWDLPGLMPGAAFPHFVLSFVHSRRIRLVHIMNSRVGFELLPEIVALPECPRVVVQLHVEEPDRSGYVRTVTTRYGNLVDAYSVSSQALADRLAEYDVPQSKRHLIRTGVDARREFSPERVSALPQLNPAHLHILFAARVTPQKDPFLMVEVARRLRSRGLDFQIHALGDGELVEELRRAIAAAGVGEQVTVHGEVLDIAPWYAACDLVLLTSLFEGVPYVAFEAMAMATPLIAPALPGLSEIVPPAAGTLVRPREDADAYVEAILGFAGDPDRRQRAGSAGRAHVSAEHSLERMTAEHAALYERLLNEPRPVADRSPSVSNAASPAPVEGDISLRNRRATERPLVSVIVPCFNHGRYLGACLASVAAQGYPALETIVIDNASSEPETLEAIAAARRQGLQVIRLEHNRGPSAARNAGIDHARGRYILPLDADNLLLPGAVAALVEQLASAGEQIGFVYPNYVFFGNRNDSYEVPSYNLDALLESNYCDTCSLFDRELFDRGLRYPEHLELGPEDWSFVLRLAERGIYGEPAHGRTFVSRKHGFTRSDLIDEVAPFAQSLPREHPTLFARRTQIKARWRPALSLVALDPRPPSPEGLYEVVQRAEEQSCQDFELIVRSEYDPWPGGLGGRLRRLDPALADSRAASLVQGLEVARGRFVLAAYGSPAILLDGPSLIEATLRILAGGAAAVAFADLDDPHRAPLERLNREGAERAQLSALCWLPGGEADPAPISVPAAEPLETLARWVGAHGTIDWRHLPRRDRRAVAGSRDDGPPVKIIRPVPFRPRDAQLRDASPPLLPTIPSSAAARSLRPGAWTPPQTRLLCRHVDPVSGHLAFTNQMAPPPGHVLQHILGSVRSLPLPGAVSLLRHGNGFHHGEPVQIDAPELLGFVDQAPLPLLDPLLIGRHAITGQPILVAGEHDPLADQLAGGRGIGYVEPYPLLPPYRRPPDLGHGLRGLVRTVDFTARRHRYAAGRLPSGELAAELGALFSVPTGPCFPLRIDAAGSVGAPRLPRRRPPVRAAIRWSGAPLRWRDGGPLPPRVRASARRTLQTVRMLTTTPGNYARLEAAEDPPVAGYLVSSPAGRTVPLFAAVHPVTGDQFLTNDRAEARSLGYGGAVLLGYLIARAPLTGTLGARRMAIPWASRFGAGIRTTA